MKRSRKGFTLVELLVVVGIIALLVTILMPTLGRAMELAKRSICGANCNGIGKQIIIYQTEHDAFPLVFRWGDCTAEVSEDTDIDDLWANNNRAVLTANPMQNLWLLMKYGCTDKMFECPSDDDYQERDKALQEATNSSTAIPLKYGWVSRRNYSYGLHKPYSDEEDASGTARNQAPLTQEPEQGSFPILTDKNGKGKDSTSSRPGWIHGNFDNSNSNRPANHKDDGFSVLSYQGSVKFYKVKKGNNSDSKAGVQEDDVYSTRNKLPIVPISAAEDPQEDYDTFIVPWDPTA